MQKYAMTGGILTIISGIFSIFLIFTGMFYINMPQLIGSDPSVFGAYQQMPEGMTGFITALGIAIVLYALITGTLAIAGGIWSLKRIHWALALTGTICATMLFFPTGIAAVIMVSLARPEFTQPANGQETDRNGTPIQIAGK